MVNASHVLAYIYKYFYPCCLTKKVSRVFDDTGNTQHFFSAAFSSVVLCVLFFCASKGERKTE